MFSEYDPVNELMKEDAFEYFPAYQSFDVEDSIFIRDNIFKNIDNDDFSASAAFAFERKGFASFDPFLSEHRNPAYSSSNDPIFVSIMVRIDSNNSNYEKLMEIRNDFIKKEKELKAKEIENEIKNLNKQAEKLKAELKKL